MEKLHQLVMNFFKAKGVNSTVTDTLKSSFCIFVFIFFLYSNELDFSRDVLRILKQSLSHHNHLIKMKHKYNIINIQWPYLFQMYTLF